jgi:hypothetical protein
MANVLSLAMKISADATGVRQSLSPVERALQQLDKEAASVTAVFRKFGSESAAAAAQQEKFEVRLRALNESLKAGLTSPQDYARSLEQLQAAANDAADDLGRAAQIVEANLTKEQRATKAYEQSIAELNRLRDAGLLDEEQYGLAVQRSAESFAKATVEANKYAAASDKAGDGGALKFNELSGVLSALPGPIGNVAGRLSGLASAGEGLSRVFGAGLSQGLTSIGASVAGLVNPFTAAVAGVAAFGAAATAVVQGLTSLEDRVENLGNTADKLGVSFEFIQTLEAAATRSGTSIDAVSAAFGRLQKSVLGVDEESKSAQKALAEIGVTSEELAALSPEEQYLRIGHSLAAIEDPARRTATSIALFGKSGADLLPFFRNLPGAAVDMERFGRALTELDRRRIDEFGAGLDALGVATQGLGQTLLLPFVGLAEGIATALADVVASITRVVDPIGRLVGPALTQLGSVIQIVGAGLNTIASIFGVLASAIEPIGQFLLPAVVAQLVAMNAAAIAGGISGLASTFVAATTATIAYATSAGAASVATVALGTAIRATLASTGVGILVVGAGLAANALLEWFSAADKTADQMDKTGASANKAADDASKLAEESKRVAAEVTKANDALNGAIAKAGEFGQAGFDAALEFQTALADLQEQADAKELNAEQYARGVANATAEYERQIESLKQVQEETRKAAEEAQRRVDADKQVADQLLEQARINREFGGDTNRAQAAEKVLAVEREIARIREEVAAAIDNGDAEAVANGEERIRQLGVIKTEQESIADGSAAAAEAERQRLDDQRARVDELLAAGQEQSEIERQIIDVQEQQAQATADLLTAREASNQAEADAAAARLAQLDQLQARLEDQQQASEQGFGEGFARAFEQVDKAIGQTINKAAEFGNAGAEAAQRLQEGIAAAQEQARDGILNKEAFDAEVARQQELFAQEIKNLEDIKKKKAQDAADEVKFAEAQRAALAKQAADAATAQQREQAQFAQAQQRQYEEAQRAQQAFAAEQAKAQAAEFDRQQKRIGELNTIGSQNVNTADVRTQEGAALVLGLAANAQDPRLIQATLTNKLLRTQANLLAENLNRIGVPSRILG